MNNFIHARLAFIKGKIFLFSNCDTKGSEIWQENFSDSRYANIKVYKQQSIKIFFEYQICDSVYISK